ncbi:unnamed protein product [Candidula unifasciata]|uniref:Uncharacterized protein n=1 Tax=Candidula unifasciata TaxID=100452 RepID=A0A8S3ZVJ2_9EUPU|nr:unnamed protein product [Candidula unifasciata]
MQQQRDICPVLLSIIREELAKCDQGDSKQVLDEKQKCMQADLQPLALEQSVRYTCNCRTSPAARNLQGGSAQDEFDSEEDFLQRMARLHRSLATIEAFYRDSYKKKNC